MPFGVRRRLPGRWLDGHGLAAGIPIGVLFAGPDGNKIQWQMDHDAPLTVSGERLDGVSAQLRLENANDIGSAVSSTTVFSSAGCWRVHAKAADQTLDGVVYVYPEACRPSNIGGHATPGACGLPKN